MVARGSAPLPAGDLFHALDTYLKTNQVRFRDLFAKYDTDRSGQLEGDEVRRLVKELLPSANEHEMRYFWVSERPCT